MILVKLYEEEITQLYEHYKARCSKGRLALEGELTARQRSYYTRMLKELEFVAHRIAKIMLLTGRLALLIDKEDALHKLPGACMSLEPAWLRTLTADEQKTLQEIEMAVRQEMSGTLVSVGGKFNGEYDFLDYPQVYKDAQEIVWSHLNYYITVKERFWESGRLN